MAVFDAKGQLDHELHDHVWSHAHRVQLLAAALGKLLVSATVRERERLHVLLQVQVEELKDQVEFVAIGVDDVVEVDDVRIIHFLEKGDLANGSARDALVLGFQADLLQCDHTVWMGQIASLVDDTVRA